MSDDVQRILDFDKIEFRPVRFHQKDLKIRQDRRAVIERVLRQCHLVTQKEEDGDRALADVLFENYDDSIPTLLLILGFDNDSPDWQEMFAAMRDDMPPTRAREIFETWWDLNQINDFFMRGGKPILPPYIVNLIQNSDDNPVKDL